MPKSFRNSFKSHLGLFVLDYDTGITDVSADLLKILGLNRSDILGFSWGDNIHPGDADRVKELFAQRHEISTPSTSLRLQGADGEWIPVHIQLSENSNGGGLIGIVEDLRDQNNAAMWRDRFERIIALTSDFVGVTDTAGGFVYLNIAARDALGIGADEDVGKTQSMDFFDEASQERMYSSIAPEMLASGRWSGDLTLKSRDGKLIPVSQASAVHYNEQGEIAYYASISRDMTEKKVLEESLLHAAMHDVLTGLPNRQLFAEVLASAAARSDRSGRSIGVVFFDLDRFKVVNDSLGHAAGDKLLIEIGKRISSAVRPGDTVARIGGDEFTVLLEDLPALGAFEVVAAVTSRVTEMLNLPLLSAAGEVFLETSAGIAIRGANSHMTPEALVRDADLAMYNAKYSGGGAVVHFDEELRERVHRKYLVETGLHRALADDELVVMYQPMIELSSGQITGVEALVRWRTPDGKLLYPSDFLAVAEESDLIIGIGKMVLDKTLAQAKRWEETPLFVSVNVAERELLFPGFVRLVAESLARHNVDPTRLLLEISERALIDEFDAQSGVLRSLRSMGVRVAIDDFGTGYSSLAHLRGLPIDVVKLDMAFVKGIVNSREDRSVVAAVMMLTRALGLEVVAEGVETTEQAWILAELGSRSAQGFLYTKAVSAEEISDLLTQFNPVAFPTRTANGALFVG